jgi:hypothetical protein
MMYHAIKFLHNIIVRPVPDGITDAEWFHGCRAFEYSESEFKLKTRIKEYSDMNLVSIEEWKELISSLDEPANVPNNNFISTHVKHDKWDTNRPIY